MNSPLWNVFRVAMAVLAVLTAAAAHSQEKDAGSLKELEFSLDSPNEQVRMLAIAVATEKGIRLSDSAIEKAINDRSSNVRRAIAAYSFLQPAHVKQLIDTRDYGVLSMLVINPRVQLDRDDTAVLLALRSRDINRLLVSKRKAPLSSEQIQQLAASDDPLTAFFIALHYRVGSDIERMITLIERSDAQDINQAISAYREVPEQIVDLLLSHPNLAVRRHLTMQGKFSPTPKQINVALNDADREVKIGLLRRRDVALSSEQINQGINHPDPSLAFWYRNRPDFRPTIDQVEMGLTSSETMTRRSYASMEKFTPTAAQIERGLSDPDDTVRSMFTRRKDITLTEQQLDRCTVDPSFQVRDPCIKRPEYRLNQKRFEDIVFDKNPNILAAFSDERRSTHTTLDPFVWKALNDSTADVQIAMAENRRLPLTEEQLRYGLGSATPGVRAAFCRRTSYAPRDQQIRVNRSDFCPKPAQGCPTRPCE